MSENVSALQRKLWATVCSFVHDAAWQKKVDFMLMYVQLHSSMPAFAHCNLEDLLQNISRRVAQALLESPCLPVFAGLFQRCHDTNNQRVPTHIDSLWSR